jgi:four helix bundle suffix protein
MAKEDGGPIPTTADTVACAAFAAPSRSTTEPSSSATASLTGVPALMTRWSRPPAAGPEYRRRQRGLGHLEEDGAQADWCSPGQPRRAAPGLRRLPRQQGLRQWAKDSSQALAVRNRYRFEASDGSGDSDPYGLRKADPETAANTLICLINQASYLLRRQLERLEKDFLDKGGFTEKLYRHRRERRASRP